MDTTDLFGTGTAPAPAPAPAPATAAPTPAPTSAPTFPTPPATGAPSAGPGGVATRQVGSGGLDVKRLLKRLLDDGTVSEANLPKLLGPDRHGLTLPKLERAIDRHAVMRDHDLLAIKGELSGRPTADPSDLKLLQGISPDIAKKILAVQVDDGSGNPTIACVHDTTEVVEASAAQLGVPAEQVKVRIATARSMRRWGTALVRQQSTVATEKALPDMWILLDTLIGEEGSDLHVQVGEPPRMRVNGEMRTLPYEPVPAGWMREQLQAVTGMNLKDQFAGHTEINQAVAFGQHRFRTVIARNQNGPTLVARLLASKIPTMQSINLPDAVQEFVNLERGLVLVTGPTGSGKSTTLAAILQTIARDQPRKIITLEDPIEYHLAAGAGGGIVDQREVGPGPGKDVTDFHRGISQALRQDPDIILVGEMRDQATVKAALEACETGHLVFSTLHTFDAPSAVTRIADFFPSDEQDSVRSTLSYVLRGVVAQSLLPSAAGKGRVGAYELMLANTAIRNNLRTPEGIAQLRGIMSTANREGMYTMEQSLAKLVRARQVTREEAAFKARDRDEFDRLLDG